MHDALLPLENGLPAYVNFDVTPPKLTTVTGIAIQSHQGPNHELSHNKTRARSTLTLMQDQSRQQSGVSSPRPSSARRAVQYTVFIRLPFARNGFVDPPPVEWDAVKDKALWKIISKGSDPQDLNWQDIAARFEVSLEFLMQQAAWLYERHFAGVRKQMQRLASTATPTPSSAPRTRGASDVGSQLAPTGMLQRAGSQSSRPSSSNVAKESPSAHAAEQSTTSAATRLAAPSFSRTPSSATITQSRLFTSAQTLAQKSSRPPQPARRPSPLPSTSRSEDHSDEEANTLLMQSQAFRRPPLSKKSTTGIASDGDVEDLGHEDDADDDDDESSSGGFLPFAAGARQDLATTARIEGATAKTSRSADPKAPAAHSSASSTSSNIPTQSTDTSSKAAARTQKLGPLSPKHRAQLAHLSPRGKSGEGSEGTPSMGSSFSDLDDTGISASALEDAVMQAGGTSIASRVSGLSQAFRSNRS